MIRNYLKMIANLLYILLFFQFICFSSNDRDPKTCATGKNPRIEIDNRHSDWCWNQVDKKKEIKKGIKIYPYSDYVGDCSKESLEKFFPADPQWKEWYKLEKEGKLPKNIRIRNRDCWYIWHDISSNSDYLRNRNLDNLLKLVFYKRDYLTATQNGIAYYQNELTRLEKEGRLMQWYEKSYAKNNPFYFSIYLDTIINWDQFNNWKRDYCYDSYTGMIFSLLELHKHPYYFSQEMNYLKEKYIPVFWDLYNNPSLITKNQEDQVYNKLELLSLLHLMGENFDTLVNLHEELNDKENTGFIFQDTIEYWDIVNAKAIEVTDLRFKPYLEKRLCSKTKSVIENALLYFYDIGELGNHLDLAKEYCYKNIKSGDMFKGFDILKLLICWRNDQRVKELAYFYLDNINEFTTSSDVESKKQFIITEFELKEKHNNTKDHKNDTK